MTPSNLGPYRLLHLLGAGGMAEVFLALQRGPSGFQKLIVVKRLREGMGNDPHFERMFLNEARLAARLSHPNVVQTFEVGVEGRVHFIAMEYLAGQPLNRVLQHAARNPDAFPLAVRLQIVSDCLAGLDYAHSMTDFDGTPLGIVHRDISPHNLFVTYDGVTKVVDFGIAKATEAPEFAEMSTTGALKGKIRYMAPEQLRGDHLDRRADVFSMGVILWEAVANGARMWAKEDDITVIMSLSDGIAKAPEAADPNVQPELAGIMRRALAGRPDERYRSADAFRIELDRYIARIGGPISARGIGAAIDRAFAADKRELDRAIHAAMDAAEDELDDAMTLLRSRESIEEGLRAVGHSKDALKALFRTPTAADPIPRIEHSTSAVVVIPRLPHEIGPSFDAGAPLPGPKRTGSVLLVGVSAMAILVLGVAALAKLRLPGARPAPTAPFGRPVPAASVAFDMVNPPVFPAAGGTGSGPAASAPSASSAASAPPSLMASALAAPAESGSRWSTGAPIGPVKTGSPTQIARPAPAPGAPTAADPAGKPIKKVAPKPASPGDGEDPPLHL